MEQVLQKLYSFSILTEDEINIIKLESKKTGQSIYDCIVKLGILNRGTLDKLLKQELDIVDFVFDISLLKKVSYTFCMNKKCIPMFIKDNCLHIALVKNDLNVIHEISTKIEFGHHKTILCSEEYVVSLIEKNYTNVIHWTDFIEGDNSSVEFFINRLLIDGFSRKASDIHISCYNNIVHVKYRINGLLRKIFSFHKDYYAKVLVKLKVIFLVDITSCFKQREGKIRKFIFGKNVDFRISFSKCINGESVVIRIIRSIGDLCLKDLGYNKRCEHNIRKMINSRDGVVFFVGPTGSGKTTSIYTTLSEFNSHYKSCLKICTVEDPVESLLPFADQIDINLHPDMNFPNTVRLIYRQDPDVLMIGEVREKDTAKVVVDIAETGHKVFTTLHARNIFAVLDRLKSFDLDVNLFIDYISGIVAQRLVPKPCLHCSGNGCELCEESGFNGVDLVSESLYFDKDVKSVLKGFGSIEEKKLKLQSMGYSCLFDSLNKFYGA